MGIIGIRGRRALLLGLGGVAIGGLARPAVAQGWPVRPPRFIIPYGAGNQADIIARHEHQLTYRLYGSLFFGAVPKIDPIVAEVERSPHPVNVMLDASQLISLDTTGLDALEQLHKALERRGGHLSMVGLNEQPRSLITRTGFASRLHTCQ